MNKTISALVNIVLINLMTFFSLLSIHEIGHLLTGSITGCAYGRIVLFDSVGSETYTELSCPISSSKNFLNFGGLIIALSFASLFLLLNSPIKNLFFIILGLSLILSLSDITIALDSIAFFYLALSVGIGLLALGEYLLAYSSIKSIDDAGAQKSFLQN